MDTTLALLRLVTLLLGFVSFVHGQQRVVCYFNNWAWYREGDEKHEPEDLDPTLCTHINYAFAMLDPNNLTVTSSDAFADIDNNMYRRVTGLKQNNPDLKVLLAIGGGADSSPGDKYSRLVSDPASRQNFINTVIPYLQEYGFDGLDLDWEYPRCWHGDCTAGPESDKQNFATFAQELRAAFDEEIPRLLLTTAVSPDVNVAVLAYDLSSLSQSLDFFNVMTYDLHSANDGVTGHHAQMEFRQGDPNPNANVVAIMNHYNSNGAPANKLVMGIPAYGKTFALADPTINGLGAPSTGVGEGNEGTLSYPQICNHVKNDGWTVVRDPQAGPYAYLDRQWVGYDDPSSSAGKGQWVSDLSFGGVMMWDTSIDDFNNICCGVNYPILRAMNYGLKGSGTPVNQLGCP